MISLEISKQRWVYAGVVIISLIASIAKLTSSAVVKRPRLNRMEAFANASDRPMPMSTCEGSGNAEVHADPEETAIFFVTAVINSLPFIPAKAKLVV